MSESNQISEIKYFLIELYNSNFELIDAQLVEFLLTQGYDKKCSVENLECENCIYLWLKNRMIEHLYEKHMPFTSYQSRLNLFLSNPNVYDLLTSYQMKDNSILSAIPQNLEESKIFTPSLDRFNFLRKQNERLNGRNQYTTCPIVFYDEMVSEYFRIRSISPLPDEYWKQEKNRIDLIVDGLSKSFKESYDREYLSILRGDEVLFGWNGNDDSLMRFHLRTYTLPIAKYHVFLQSANITPSNQTNCDKDLYDIELELRRLILEALAINSISKFQQKIHGDILKGIGTRIDGEKTRNFNETQKRESDPKYRIAFTDLTDLGKIIGRKDNWVSFVSHFGKNKDVFLEEFRNLCNLRNAIRHARNLNEVILYKGTAAIIWFKQQLKM